jgi:alkylation response protein AidB-like acyl-CoA dehydrogenase
MDFDFSDDQESLRDAVQRWVDKGYDFERRKSIVKDDGGFSRTAYGELAELGLTGLYVPEDHGGMGFGPVDAMVVMEELGRGIVMEPIGQTLAVTGVLGAYADASVLEAWLPKIASGESLVTLAYLERKTRYRHDTCETRASKGANGTDYTLTGTKSVVIAGDKADGWLVSAMLDNKLALFLVAKGASGASTQGYGTQDGGRAAELTLSSTPATLAVADGATALDHGLDIAIAAACAEAVGIMDKAVATTAEYLNTRKQFGVVISSFQALRHRMADLKMQLELARSMSYYATLKLNAPAEERSRAIARAKVQLGQSMRFVGQQSVQLHGGIGMTDEYIVSHYFRRLTQLEMSFGDTLYHLGQVSEHMTETAGVFA